jgi:hypothetical protein
MHKVRFSIPERELGTANIEFKVNQDGMKFGTLRISKGSIVWFPRDKSKGHKVGWIKFDEFMRTRKRIKKRN